MSRPSLWHRFLSRLAPSATVAAQRPSEGARHPHPPSGTGEELRSDDSRDERGHRKEQLFGVLKENMARAGVLSSAYKFKVLTVDRQGRRFIVMFDVDSDATDCRPAALQALERTIQDEALEHTGAEIQAVYWRARNKAPSPAPEVTGKERLEAFLEKRRQEHPRDFEPTQPMTREDEFSDTASLGQPPHGKAG